MAYSFDPFRTIVEVGWPNWRYIACRLIVRTVTNVVNDTEHCAPAVVGPGGNYHYDYISGVTYTVDEQPDSISISRNGINWVAPDEGVVFAGIPAAPGTFTHGAWEYMWSLGGFGFDVDWDEGGLPGDPVNGIVDPDDHGGWTPDTGTPIEPVVPEGGSPPFETGITPTWGFWSAPYTSSTPICFTDGFLNSNTRPYNPSAEQFDLFPITVSGITATYKGMTFTGIAAKILTHTFSVGGVPSFTKGQFCWILLERDDPTP